MRRARHLFEGPHLDARRVHVDEEVGDAAMLRLVEVGSCEEDAEVAVVGSRGPHLLPVDDPLVAVSHRSGGQPGEIAPCARLAEELAPHLVAAQGGRQVAPPLLFGTVSDDRRPRHRHAYREGVHGQADPGRLLREDGLFSRRASTPARVLGPGDSSPPVVGEVGLPRLGQGDPALPVASAALEDVAGRFSGGGIRQPGTRLGAEGCFLRALVEVHGRE